MLSAVQLDVLDGYCGAEVASLRDEVGEAYARVRDLEERVDELREVAAGRERELDLLGLRARRDRARVAERGRGG